LKKQEVKVPSSWKGKKSFSNPHGEEKENKIEKTREPREMIAAWGEKGLQKVEMPAKRPEKEEGLRNFVTAPSERSPRVEKGGRRGGKKTNRVVQRTGRRWEKTAMKERKEKFGLAETSEINYRHTTE